MRLLSTMALGGGMASAATAGWLVAAGVFATSATLVVADPAAGPAAADELAPFDSCGALLDWYVERGVHDVGPWGWDQPWIAYAEGPWADDGLTSLARAGDVPAAAAVGQSTKSLDARSSSATGTNTQEADVDEPDVAKTDGSLVVRIVADRTVVLVDVAHGEPAVLHRYRLPEDGGSSELLLVGDHVLVSQQVWAHEDPRALGGDLVPSGRIMPGYGGTTSTRVLDLDISDPSDPRLVSTDTYTGTLITARQYGDTIRLVTSTGRPQLDWVVPGKRITEREATRRNRALVRATTIEDWLPSVTRNGETRRLADCDEVYHPRHWSGPSTVAVTTFGIDDTARARSVAVTAEGQVVYSSADRLYVASTDWDDDRPGPLAGFKRRVGVAPRLETSLHAFALDAARTTYFGSGHVDGSLRDRWSLDEHDGDLRVAWSTTSRRGAIRNGITVLTEKGDRLEPIGTVDGLGPDEDLQSVRWFDDLAIMVTFRQVDPLYTVDLSDPTHPRTLGELKIPGYSGYLHPLGDDLLLGLGVHADRNGTVRGTQAAVFDISDVRRPRQVSTVTFPGDTGLPALDDPRAFTWLAGARTGVTPLAHWNAGSSELLGLAVSPTGLLTERTVADLNHDWQARTLELPGNRVAVLDSHRVRVVGVG